LDRDQDSHTASNLGAFASSWLAALRFTSDAKAPTPAGPAIFTKDVGRIFFSGNKAQRKRAMPEKNDAVRGLRAPWIKSRLGTAPQEARQKKPARRPAKERLPKSPGEPGLVGILSK